jgi:hypothetical protein
MTVLSETPDVFCKVDGTRVCLLFYAGGASLLYQQTFQNPATPPLEGIIDLHHKVMFCIIVFVL